MWLFFIEIINGNIPIKLGRFNLANIRNINYTALHVWEVTTFERVISSGAHQKVKSISLKSELFKQTFETLLKMALRSSIMDIQISNLNLNFFITEMKKCLAIIES